MQKFYTMDTFYTAQKKESLKIVNWNLQTFFDAKFDGNEYDEYKSSKSGWNLTKYEERLNRLATAIKELDADVFVMEELEKEAQLQDIANQLSGTFNFSHFSRELSTFRILG